jgi:hypothetical protein
MPNCRLNFTFSVLAILLEAFKLTLSYFDVIARSASDEAMTERNSLVTT